MGNIEISIEDGTTIIIEDDKETSSTKKDFSISSDQFINLIKLFNTNCEFTPYTESDISYLESELDFKLGKKTSDMLLSIGNLKVSDFEVPNKEKLISLTNEWKNNIATEDQKSKYIVIEADGDDYTLVDKDDMIFVYDGKEKKTESYDEDVYTHIGKHFMSKLVGDKYKY